MKSLTITNKSEHTHPFAWQRISLLFVLAYEALGALFGGPALIVAPDGHLFLMPVEIMHGTFEDFTIPGIILTILGIINAFAFFSVLFRKSSDWIWSALALGGFLIWFLVEIIVLQRFHWLHIMWGLPVLLGCVAARPLFRVQNRHSY